MSLAYIHFVGNSESLLYNRGEEMAAIWSPINQRGMMADTRANLLHLYGIPDVHFSLQVLEAANQQKPIERWEPERVAMVNSDLKNGIPCLCVDHSVGRHEAALDQEAATLGEPAEAMNRTGVSKNRLEFLRLWTKKIEGILSIIRSSCLVDEVTCLD